MGFHSPSNSDVEKKWISNIVFVLYRKQNIMSFLTGVQGDGAREGMG